MSDEISSNHREEDIARVDKHVQALGEHFDCVQIFCSRHMPAELDGTISINRGGGNWFARYGQITEWVKYEDEKIREAARPKKE